MKEFYTIGEISKIFNVPEPTLRYYDSIDLLTPWIIGENGYRYYSKAQFEIISTITLLRDMGTPLKRMKKALNENTADGIRNELSSYSEEIDSRIARLEYLKKHADALKETIEQTCYSDEIKVEALPEFHLLTNSFGEKDELDIAEIYAANSEISKWPKTAGIISTISRENLLASNFHTYEEYGYISEEPLSTGNPHYVYLPSGKYLTGNMKVSSVEHFEADSYYLRMMTFIKEQGLTISGPAIERNILDLYNNDPHNPIMYFKIYIPIRDY